ncbi:MAG: Yip1 family protein [Litoreibacter sp.]|uniref:Yip1 family protein n=1 Tax=Litoreibacter sp. TaxID=1969459 RepID=UPI0032994489
MFEYFLSLILLTLRSPREAAGKVLKLDLDRRSLWTVLTLTAVISSLMSELTLVFVPTVMVAEQSPLPSSPIVLALVIWALLTITALASHFIGRAFDGEGSFDESLLATIWMQVVLLAMQVVQIGLFLVAPPIALMFGWAGALYMFGVFLIFVQVLHGFKSLGGVVAGAVIGFIGIMLSLGVILAVISVIFGVELAADV